MLVPPRIIERDPNGLSGADNIGWCRCDDTNVYALKDQSIEPSTPHNEWFCTHLAEAIGIAGPPCAIIEDPNHSQNFVFGSRWEGGVIKSWVSQAASGTIDFRQLRPTLSRIFAFDQFIYNEDRREANFIVRNNLYGHSMLAMDYSRAWLNNGFPMPAGPLHTSNTTVQFFFDLKAAFGSFLLLADFDDCLDRLNNIPVDRVEDIINLHPASWLIGNQKSDILAWWNSSHKLMRLSAIRKEVANGTYI